MLVFIMWHEHHFSLLVGFNEESRWEYYNSLKSDRTTINVAKAFIDFIGNQFSNYGEYVTGVSTLLVKTKIPYQDNGNDCGVFTLAYAEHLAARIPIDFTAADIPYYRSKIVVDNYGRSWEMKNDHLPIDPLT